MPDDRIWYLWTANGQERPYTHDELGAWYEGGHINGEWYVWREGLAEWQLIKDTPELVALLTAPAPPSRLFSRVLSELVLSPRQAILYT